MTVVTTISLTQEQADWLDKNIKNKSELIRELLDKHIEKYANPEQVIERRYAEIKDLEEKLMKLHEEKFDLEQIVSKKNDAVIRREIVRLTEFEGLKEPVDIQLAVIKSLGPKIDMDDVIRVVGEFFDAKILEEIT